MKRKQERSERSSADWTEDDHDGCGYFWLPSPPEGYKSLGYLVTKGPNKPSLEEVRCVRCDLTEICEAYDLIVDMEPMFPKFPCQIRKTRPSFRGMWGKGLSVGTFSCSTNSIFPAATVAALPQSRSYPSILKRL